jgi:gluconokinase
MENRAVVIGLDVGTTAAKAAAFAIGSPWRQLSTASYRFLPAPAGSNEATQDPRSILLATSTALRACVAATRGALGDADVLAISLSAAMHGLVGLDANREPMTAMLTWADARATAEAAELRGSGEARELQAVTGLPVQAMSPLAKLLWFARHDPSTFATVHRWVGLKEYLVNWLTGTVATELSSASGTGLLDLETLTWSRLALERCGLVVEQLAPILATTATLALAERAAAELDLPKGTPVVIGAGDGPLSNLGVGAIAPGVAGLSLGTSAAIRVVVEGPIPDPDGQLFCLALADPLWVVGGAISNGGAVVQWISSQLLGLHDDRTCEGEGDDAGEIAAALEAAERVAPGSDGLVMLPFVLAERAPLADPELAGAFLGLRRAHTGAHLVRAAVEGVAAEMRALLDRVERAHPVHGVRATGGGFAAPLWRDAVAAAIGQPIELVVGAGGAALGAAALGLVAVGRATDLAEALELLGSAVDTPVAPLEAPPRLVTAFADRRATLTTLLGALDDVAADTVARRGP